MEAFRNITLDIIFASGLNFAEPCLGIIESDNPKLTYMPTHTYVTTMQGQCVYVGYAVNIVQYLYTGLECG